MLINRLRILLCACLFPLCVSLKLLARMGFEKRIISFSSSNLPQIFMVPPSAIVLFRDKWNSLVMAEAQRELKHY